MVERFKVLGIVSNKHLTWTEHINKVAFKISKSIGIFLRLSTYLQCDILLLLYKYFILPHINYALMA